jgi:hypothetical protein
MMNGQRPNLFVPALIGGAVAGTLSSVPLFNCLCCIWIIGGAVLAAYVLVENSPDILSAGDGAIVGILTGIIAAVVHSIIDIPLRPFVRGFFQNVTNWLAEYAEETPSGWDDWLWGELSAFGFFLQLIASAAFFSILGALGGIIGISLFRKKGQHKIQGRSDASQDGGHHQP